MTTPQARIRILVVDDHTLFRRGLTALLGCDASLEVVGDAGDAGEAQRKAEALKPDVILLDNHLPGVRGVDAVPALLAAVPGVRVLLLTMSEDEADLAAALRGGAQGYLLKTIEGEALSAALHRAMRGEHVIANEMTGKLVSAFKGSTASPEPVLAAASASPLPAPTLSPLAALSPRETEILRALASGASNKEIARTLDIAESTVKIHVQHLLRKLDVSSRVQLAVIANQHDLR